MAAELKLTVTPVAGSADMTANTSLVKIVLQIVTTDGTYNLTGSTAGSLTLDGAKIASLDGKKVQKDTTTTLYSAKRTVQHDPDGTKTVTVKASFDVDTSVGWLAAEKTAALPAITRCGTLTVPELTCGEAALLTVTPVAEGFTHAIVYDAGGISGTAVEETAATELWWTPPMALCHAMPHSAAGQVRLTLVSYRDGVETGRREDVYTLRVPASVVPRVGLTVTVENDDAVITGWGVAVKGRSRLHYVLDAQPGEGAALTHAAFTFGQQSAEGTEGDLIPARAGSFAPSASVTDSRGRMAGAMLRAMNVYDYAPPAVRTARVWRCDGEGRPDSDGAYAAVVLEAEGSAVGGRNGLRLTCRYRSVGGAWSGETPLVGGETTVLPGFDLTRSYEVELIAADTVGEVRRVRCTVPTAAVAFALADGGAAAGFGKYPEKDGLDMGWPIHMNGHPLTGLPQPADDSDATPWGSINFDRIYPVGSLYLTVADIDPAALFGGTWQRIKDRFLLASGSVYAPGTTGGEAAHTLTVQELPQVSGEAEFRSWGKGTPITAARGALSRGTTATTALNFATGSELYETRTLTLSFGGGQSHNNMPPYLAVNVWQRTA